MFILTTLYGKKICAGSLVKCLNKYREIGNYYNTVVWELKDGKAHWVRGG